MPYIADAFNTSTPLVGFNPRITQTTVSHVTTRPLQTKTLNWKQHHVNFSPHKLCSVFIYIHHHTTTVLRPLFRDYLGEPTPEENLDFMVQGKINRRRHTDHLPGRHSIPSNQCPPPPSPHLFILYDIIYLQDVVNCIKHDGDDFGVLDGQHITQWLHSLTMYTVRDLLHGAAWSQVGNHPNSLLLALEVTLFYQHTSISVTWNKQSYNTSIQTAMWIIYHRLEQLSPFHLTQDNPCTMILWRTNLRHN